MELKIRGIDPSVVKDLDERAKAQGASRNEYLVTLLSNFTAVRAFENLENKYADLERITLDALGCALRLIADVRMILTGEGAYTYGESPEKNMADAGRS